MALTHTEGWQSGYPAKLGVIATCSFQAMVGKVGMVRLIETWAPFLNGVLLFQVIYIHAALQDSSQQTAKALLWESPWYAGTDEAP